MNKVRVVHHAKTVGYSGTDRTAQLFCKYLSRSDKYEPFLVYREGDVANTRLDIARKWLGDDRVIPYRWVPGNSGRNAPWIPEESNLGEVLANIDPQIVHIHRSGYHEWPGFKSLLRELSGSRQIFLATMMLVAKCTLTFTFPTLFDTVLSATVARMGRHYIILSNSRYLI